MMCSAIDNYDLHVKSCLVDFASATHKSGNQFGNQSSSLLSVAVLRTQLLSRQHRWTIDICEGQKAYWVVHCLGSQQHDSLGRGELLHASILLLAGSAQGFIGFFLLHAHALPLFTSFLPNDLHCNRFIRMISLQATDNLGFVPDLCTRPNPRPKPQTCV